MDQSVDRHLSFDAQVYMTGKAEQEIIDEIESQSFVTGFMIAGNTCDFSHGMKGNNFCFLK